MHVKTKNKCINSIFQLMPLDHFGNTYLIWTQVQLFKSCMCLRRLSIKYQKSMKNTNYSCCKIRVSKDKTVAFGRCFFKCCSYLCTVKDTLYFSGEKSARSRAAALRQSFYCTQIRITFS